MHRQCGCSGPHWTMKRCKDCGEEKSLEDFNTSANGTYGKDTYCRPCRSVRNKRWRLQIKSDPYLLAKKRQQGMESARRARTARPESMKEINRRFWLAIKADPVRHRKYLESQRMWYRLRQERLGRVSREGGGRYHLTESYTRIDDVKPIFRALDLWMAENRLTPSDLALRAGIDEGILRHAKASGHISVDSADRLVTATGGALSLYVEYE